MCFFFFKQKTAYEMRISDWSSDVCSSDLLHALIGKEFVAAAPVLTLMLLASTFDLISSSLRSAAYAIGHAGKVLRIYALSAGIFLVAFVAFTSWLGLIAPGLAACVAATFSPLARITLIRTRHHTPMA